MNENPQGDKAQRQRTREANPLDLWLAKGDSAWLRYGVAVLAVVVALVIDEAMVLSGSFRIYLIFYLVIMIATLYGGRGPGLLATALSCFAATYLWVQPAGKLAFASRPEGGSIALFILGNFVVVWICEWLHRALRDAARQARLLKESEQRLSLAQKAGQVGVFDWDLLSGKVVWTPELEELFGLSVGSFEQTYEGWAKRVDPEDEARLSPFFKEWIQSGREREIECWEYRIQHPDGQWRWIAARGQIVRDATGQAVRMIGTNRDVTNRHQAEEELLRRKKQLEEAQRVAHLGSWQWDPLTDAVTWSEELFRIFGRDPKLPPPPFSERASFYTPESWAQLDAAVQRALQTGMNFQLSLEFIRPDGIRKWVSARGEAVRDANGNVARLIGTVQDITESKQAEENLRASETKFRIVADNTYDWEFWLSPTGEFLYTSPSCLRITGHTAEEFQADSELLFRIMHPDDHAAYLHHRSDVTQKKTAGEVEFRVIRPDGIERWIAHACQPVFSEEGQFLGVRGSNRDITEKKHAEEALQQSEQRLRFLLRISPDTVCFKDGEGRWMVANEALLRLFGLTGTNYQGKKGLELAESSSAYWDALQVCEESDALALRKREMIRSEESIFQPDGSTIVMEFHKIPVFHADGKPEAILVLGRDITERKKMEQEFKAAKEAAVAANAAKEQFIAVLSHELRTPLTPVLATVTALEDQPDLSAAMRADMELVHRNVEMEAALIDDLLDMTRINTGKLVMHPAAVDAQACLQAALGICQNEIEAKHLKLSLSPPAEEHHVWADPTRLQQVFWNLLRNAVKFTPEGGRIRIRSTNHEGRLKVEITDTGIGIPPEVLPRVFNAFEQGERSTTRFFGGLGLGLSIAKALVEIHHGSLTAFSQGKDKGSTFTVDLATVSPAVLMPPASPPASAPPAEESHKILLVEDHVDTLQTMAKLLRRLGYTVATASSVHSALDLAAKERFDLVISDLGLPDGSGLNVMRQVSKLYSLHGIALSGYGTDEDIRQSREAGFDEHVTKPVSFDTLRETVHRVLAEWAHPAPQ